MEGYWGGGSWRKLFKFDLRWCPRAGMKNYCHGWKIQLSPRHLSDITNIKAFSNVYFPTHIRDKGYSNFSRPRATFSLSYRLESRKVMDRLNLLKLQGNLLRMQLGSYCTTISVTKSVIGVTDYHPECTRRQGAVAWWNLAYSRNFCRK